MNVLVSACLLGINCKYNGGNNYIGAIEEILKTHQVIPVCPEQLGGLTTPRNPVELVGEDKKIAMNTLGEDVTASFQKGAEETLKLAKLFDCKMAILKENSPSCGYGTIYDGTFSHKKIAGAGMTAKLLEKNDIKILGETAIHSC